MNETDLGMTLAALIEATIIRTLLELVAPAPWPRTLPVEQPTPSALLSDHPALM